VIPDDIASAVQEKEHQDNAEIAKLISKGTPVARMNTGIDGGMNRVFAAKLPEGQTGLSDPVEPSLRMAAYSPAPGTIPSSVNPPRDPTEAAAAAAPASEPMVAVTKPSPLFASAPNAKSDSIFGSLARKIGFGGSETTASTKPPAPIKPKAAAPRHGTPHHEVAAAKSTPHRTNDRVEAPKQVATARPPFKPAVAATDAPSPPPASAALPGAAPVVSSNSFDSRFSAIR
jgi:hypothetical protein